MGKKQKAIDWLFDRAHHQHQQASMLVARSARALNEARTTEQALQDFLAERNQQQRDVKSGAVAVDSIQLAAGFAERLNQAISHQAQTVSTLRSAHAANADVLMNAHRSVKSLEFLRESQRRKVLTRMRLAEQRETDEWVAIKYRTDQTGNQGN